MMEGVVKRGTGHVVAALKRPVAGKTGTTNDLADAWFVGFTPEFTTGVWVGRDQRARLGRSETGGRAAAPIFLYFMTDLLKELPPMDFEIPSGVSCAEIDLENGYWATETTERRQEVCFKTEHMGKSDFGEYVSEPDTVEGAGGPARTRAPHLRRRQNHPPGRTPEPENVMPRPDQPALPRQPIEEESLTQE